MNQFWTTPNQREPYVPLRCRPDRDRDIFAAADLGAIRAFHLDHDWHGVSDYVRISDAANLNPGTSDFSLDFWMKTASPPQRGNTDRLGDTFLLTVADMGVSVAGKHYLAIGVKTSFGFQQKFPYNGKNRSNTLSEHPGPAVTAPRLMRS